MNACLSRTSKWRNYPANFFILPVLAVFLSQSCWGEQASLTPVFPSQPVNWIAGPKEASLGTLADIKVPQGYRLTDEAGARVLLGRMKNPVPDGLIGILVPDSGKWWMVLTFSDTGYVKGADKEHMDPVAILQAVQKRSMMENNGRAEQGMASIVSVNWERPPVYDAERHSLEWAFRAETKSSKAVNDTMLLLGRRGVLAVIVVQPYDASSDLVPLQQLIKNITFKEGQRYADYESGDKIADVNLSQLIINDKHQAGSGDLMASSRGGIVVWIYSSLAGCGVMAGGMLLYKKRRQRKVRNLIYANGGDAIPAAQVSPGNGHGNGHANGSGSVFARSDIQKGGSSPDNRGKLRRRKVFDYSKFYTHVVMELSSKSNFVAGSMLNGNGNGNGGSNLHMVNHTNGTNNVATTTSQAITDATLDLIASQKNLIEEQKHLMQQQTGLIEERRKLIEEQNALLKRQAEMIESQYSLKLD
jgi:uncharacterized membrane-anchored protein